ncbi:winged helix-turn-helix domain-containing protein [Hymenobacter terrenus]|uniref:winged helix-turn-helix domain-containing protein n=1 Tax=Hymenobacter terrenus TaxID=1629124 RepID=UPI000619EA49|nr:winged helix-turn-helix domain-containing protein [Hymenobacter terrenus]
MAWVGAACQQVRRLVPRLGHELGLRVSPRTRKRALRRAGYGWKRTRRSLKRQRDPAACAACRQQLAALHRAELAGHGAVYYADEVRFSRQAPVPYAWQVRGRPCAGLPAERGASGG